MTSVLDQLSSEPLRAAPGTLSTRGLTLTWDLDQLTINGAGERQVVGFAEVSVQLSRSVTEPSPLRRRHRHLLRVELRGPDGLRLRLRALADAARVTGLPELDGRNDHTVDLDALRVLIDAARAGGATLADAEGAGHGMVLAAPEGVRRAIRRPHARRIWAAVALSGAAIIVHVAAQLAGSIDDTLAVMLVLALLAPLAAAVQFVGGLGRGHTARRVLSWVLGVGVALYFTMQPLFLAGLVFGSGLEPAMACWLLTGYGLLQLGAHVWCTRATHYHTLMLSPRGIVFRGALVRAPLRIDPHTPLASAEQLLSPATAPLQTPELVCAALDLASGRLAPSRLAEHLATLDARAPSGRLEVLQRRSNAGPILTAVVLGIALSGIVAARHGFTLAYPLLAGVLTCWAWTMFRICTVALDPQRALLVERAMKLPDPLRELRPGVRVPASVYFDGRAGASWRAHAASRMRGLTVSRVAVESHEVPVWCLALDPAHGEASLFPELEIQSSTHRAGLVARGHRMCAALAPRASWSLELDDSARHPLDAVVPPPDD